MQIEGMIEDIATYLRCSKDEAVDFSVISTWLRAMQTRPQITEKDFIQARSQWAEAFGKRKGRSE